MRGSHPQISAYIFRYLEDNTQGHAAFSGSHKHQQATPMGNENTTSQNGIPQFVFVWPLSVGNQNAILGLEKNRGMRFVAFRVGAEKQIAQGNTLVSIFPAHGPQHYYTITGRSSTTHRVTPPSGQSLKHTPIIHEQPREEVGAEQAWAHIFSNSSLSAINYF